MFLNPLLLLGLTAVSVPIIIHLLNRRKFERVVWAAMRFVNVAVQQNQRRVKIEDLLLLIIRCVLIALIVFALARPAISGAGGMFGLPKTTAVVLIDNSYSMSQVEGASNKFEQAKRVADAVIDALPRGSSVAVYLASDIATPVIEMPTFDLAAAREAITKAQLSDRSSNMLPPIQRAVELLQNQSAVRKDLYLITDTQQHGWKQTGDIQKLLVDNQKEIKTTLLFVGEPEQRNLGVSDLKIAGDLPTMNRPVLFNVQVTNFGAAEARDVPVKISVNGEAESDQAVIDAIPAGGSKSVTLSVRFKKEGYQTVTARINKDVLPADDQRTIVVRALKQVNVLIVDGDPGREPRDAKSFYLREALQPVPPDVRENFYVQTRIVSTGELESTRLDEMDAIFLANVTDLAPATTTAIERFVKNGGGLVIMPGATASPNYYNEQLGRRLALLPALLNEPRGDASQAARFWTFQTKHFDHPIVALWGEGSVGSMASAKFFRTYDLELLPAKNAGGIDAGTPRVVATFNDGKPAIVERTFGEGRVVLFAVGADTAWSDLPVRPQIFIPLMHRTLSALVQRQDESINIRVGQKFVYRMHDDVLGKDALIKRNNDEKNVQDSRRVEAVNNVPTLTFDRTDNAGAYTVNFGTDTAAMFATQPDAAESKLDGLTQDQTQQLATASHVIKYTAGMNVEQALKKEQIGTELWLPLAIIALAIAATETLLAHLFSRSK